MKRKEDSGSTYGGRLAEALRLYVQDHPEVGEEKVRAALAKALESSKPEKEGVSVQSLSQVISGKTKAHTAANCLKAARFLEVDPTWLATGEGEPRPAMMKERASLSLDAVRHAVDFDKLTPKARKVWHSLLDAAEKLADEEEGALGFPTVQGVVSDSLNHVGAPSHTRTEKSSALRSEQASKLKSKVPAKPKRGGRAGT